MAIKSPSEQNQTAIRRSSAVRRWSVALFSRPQTAVKRSSGAHQLSPDRHQTLLRCSSPVIRQSSDGHKTVLGRSKDGYSLFIRHLHNRIRMALKEHRLSSAAIRDHQVIGRMSPDPHQTLVLRLPDAHRTPLRHSSVVVIHLEQTSAAHQPPPAIIKRAAKTLQRPIVNHPAPFLPSRLISSHAYILFPSYQASPLSLKH